MILSSTTKIYIAGHEGLVGSALLRFLESKGHSHTIVASRKELNLENLEATQLFLEKTRPDVVINAAAKVGGILANHTYAGDFIYSNLASTLALTHAALRSGVKRYVFLGSSCIYPRLAPQPIPEDALLTSPLESTNEAYAIAKIAGLKLCQYYRKQYGVLFHSVMPTNLYGPKDNYNLETAHVLPALIRKFHEAKLQQLPSISVWGDGSPKREFLHVDDLATAIFKLCTIDQPLDWVNIGSGRDLSIKELAQMIAHSVGFKGQLLFDPTQPNGTPRKLLDSTHMRSLGWEPSISLEEGIRRTYAEFEATYKNKTARL
jgi:GDP-L-fucose synthase